MLCVTESWIWTFFDLSLGALDYLFACSLSLLSYLFEDPTDETDYLVLCKTAEGTVPLFFVTALVLPRVVVVFPSELV